MILQNVDMISNIDKVIHVNLDKFKDELNRLSQHYNTKKNDYSRNLIKEGIIKELLWEREILTAELDYLGRKINIDSLLYIIENSFRK